ncbi:MAG: GTP cyclohydrolase I FolE [Planctomycetota bacterium]|jgi:GTP cyclohydrolase I
MEELIQDLLRKVGEDPERQGLRETPARVARSYEFLLSGYGKSVAEEINGALYQEDCDEMIVVKDIELYSLCEHHMLPFFGRCHVAYLARGQVVGLSKIARIVEVFARRLQVQERLTVEIARALEEHLQPRGVGVVVEASHLCMMMRGVQKQNSKAVTSCMLGRFRSDPKTRAEFLGLIQR